MCASTVPGAAEHSARLHRAADPNRYVSDPRDHGMVSTENRIIGACVVVAVTLWIAVVGVGSAPDWIGYAVLIGVGVLLPGVLTRRYG